MKKLLFIIPAFKHGGTNKSLLNLIPFIKNDFDVTVFSLSNLGPYKNKFEEYVNILDNNVLLSCIYDNLGVVDYKNESFYTTLVKISKKILRKIFITIIGYKGQNMILNHSVNYIDKLGFDTIIAMQEGTATYFASLAKGNKIAWIRSDYKEYYNIINKDERYIYEKFKTIICVSEFTRQSFINKYPEFKKKCYSIHNIIDYKTIVRLSNDEINRLNYLKVGSYNIVSIGRLSKVKQFHIIPKIAKNLLDKRLNIMWYIIGEGEERAIIKNEIKKNKVEKHVFLLGEIDNPYPYIKYSNLVAVTSLSEACPNVLNESKIIHKPLITMNFGSSKEFIINGVNGVISNEKSFTNDIERLIKDKNYYNTIQLNINEFVYSNDKIISQIKSFLS